MIKHNDLKLSYKLNNEMKEQTSFQPVKDYNIVKIIEKRVEKFKTFLFHFINKEMSKFILPDYNLKKEIQEFFVETDVKYYFIDNTKETLKDIFDEIFDELVKNSAVSVTGFIEYIIASNQDLDFDNCEVEPQISEDGRIIWSYEFIFGDSQYSKFVDITKKAKKDMQSIIDKIVENEESFKGEVISLIDETDNKLSTIINNYINK
jgi:hypothetical protein